MAKLLATLEHKVENPYDKKLVTKVEVLDWGITLYGRARDGGDWPEKMQELIKLVNPPVFAHDDEATRAEYHPNGPAKKRGEHYFHHVHYKGSEEKCASKILAIKKEGFIDPYFADTVVLQILGRDYNGDRL